MRLQVLLQLRDPVPLRAKEMKKMESGDGKPAQRSQCLWVELGRVQLWHCKQTYHRRLDRRDRGGNLLLLEFTCALLTIQAIHLTKR